MFTVTVVPVLEVLDESEEDTDARENFDAKDVIEIEVVAGEFGNGGAV